MTDFIPTKVHGIVDYLAGALLLSSPWLFGFAYVGGAALFIPIYFGVLSLVMTIFTNHETGMIKILPLQIHLTLDVLAGFVLLIAPFLYKFYPLVVWPHVVFGLLLMGAGIFTKGSPFLAKPHAFNGRGL